MVTVICRDSPLSEGAARKITRTISMSGLHDLRPLMATAMNDALRIDSAHRLELRQDIHVRAKHPRDIAQYEM